MKEGPKHPDQLERKRKEQRLWSQKAEPEKILGEGEVRGTSLIT